MCVSVCARMCARVCTCVYVRTCALVYMVYQSTNHGIHKIYIFIPIGYLCS